MAGEKTPCREIVGMIGAYRDGDLPEPRRSDFAAHLARCAKCRAYLASYEAAIGLARAALGRSGEPGADPVPEELVNVVLSRRPRKP